MNHFCVERKLQLKVCEGCGILWLRPQNHGVYCASCTQLLADFPAPRRHRQESAAHNRRSAARRVLTIPVVRAAAAASTAAAATAQGGAR